MYWLLHDVCGLNDREIAAGCGISTSTLGRVVDGHETPTLISAMHALIQPTLDRLALAAIAAARYVDPSGEVKTRPTPSAISHHRRHVFALVAAVAAPYAPRPPSPARTPLRDLIVAALGTMGDSRASVIARLRTPHRSAATIRRAARALGVVDSTRLGVAWWWLPSSAQAADPNSRPPPPPAEIRQPTTERARALYDRLTMMLGKAPGFTLPARDAIEQLRARGFSRHLIFRAVRDMRIVRETRGFGPAKQTLWMLPRPSAPSEHVDADESVDDLRRAYADVER